LGRKRLQIDSLVPEIARHEAAHLLAKPRPSGNSQHLLDVAAKKRSEPSVLRLDQSLSVGQAQNQRVIWLIKEQPRPEDRLQGVPSRWARMFEVNL
jgi:hypothetical protein